MTTLNDAFEKLRLQAEADTADAGTDKRRPSWGPALVLGDEILTALAELNHPLPDKKVARLWAVFAGRDKVSARLRAYMSTLPMPEVKVRAFELRLGTDRSGERLLQAKRGSSGLWDVKARILSRFPGQQERWKAYGARQEVQSRMQRLDFWINGFPAATDEQREQARRDLPEVEAALASCELVVAKIEADYDRYEQRRNAFGERIKQRVAEFAGAQVTGNCAICGRGLTDPISLERGIGPECYGKIAPQLRAYVERLEAEAAA